MVRNKPPEREKDPAMAKGQKRSNREPKKPKQPKALRASGVSASAPAPTMGDTAVSGRGATRIGRR